MSDKSPVPVVVAFRNRPVYLWNCLDALYRHTQSPARFFLIDMASDDALIPQVVSGFQRRGMITEYIRMETNDPAHLIAWITAQLPDFGDVVAYVEGDAVLCDRSGCWLEEMASLMRDNPALAMLGAAIDKRDFVDPAEATALEPNLPAPHLAGLIKAHSPERDQLLPIEEETRIFHPHNPAGRLLLLRCAALQQVGVGEDWAMHRKFVDAGYQTGVSTRVSHRHMSLLHIFDYPDYDLAARNAYMTDLNRPQAEQGQGR